MATETIRLPVNIIVEGNLAVMGDLPAYARSQLIQDDFQAFPLDHQLFRVWDAFLTSLGTAAADDLGIATGVFATGLPYITAGDLKAAGATTRYGRIAFTLPHNYVAGQTVRLRVSAGMLTTVADTSCTVDCEVYKSARNTLKTGSDLVATAATTINSLTFAEKTFDVTATGLAAGDVLDIRVAVACTDAATVTAVTPALAHVEMQLDVKG